MDLQSNTCQKLHYPHKCWMVIAGNVLAVNLNISRGCVRCSIDRKVKSCWHIHFSIHIDTKIIKQYCKIKTKENEL